MHTLQKICLSVIICLISSNGIESRPPPSPSSSSSRPSFSPGSKHTAPSFSPGSKHTAPSFSPGSKPTAPSFSPKSPKPSFTPGSKISHSPIAGKTPERVVSKPAAPKWDSLAGKDMKKAESRKAYEKAHAPAPTYKTPTGQQVNLDPKDKQIAHLRGQLDEQRWVNRGQREQTFYSSYSSRPVIIYNDCYHPSWNYFLMSQSISTMSMWIYMHQANMDAARLNWYYSQNSELRARVAALEAQRLPRDPTWNIKGVDSDMCYNDNYVNAVYNPQPKNIKEYHYSESSQVGWILLWIFLFIPMMIATSLLLVWLIFFVKWQN